MRPSDKILNDQIFAVSLHVIFFQDLHRKEGVRGLFKGIKTCVPYAFIGTSQLTAFGCTKDYLNQYDVFKEDKLLTATIAGTSGAVVLSALMTPFDNIVSKYNYQGEKFVKNRRVAF